MYMNYCHNPTRGMITYVIIRFSNTLLDGGLYDSDKIQTVSHVLQTGSPAFNYTHQQLKFTIHIQA